METIMSLEDKFFKNKDFLIEDKFHLKKRSQKILIILFHENNVFNSLSLNYKKDIFQRHDIGYSISLKRLNFYYNLFGPKSKKIYSCVNELKEMDLINVFREYIKRRNSDKRESYYISLTPNGKFLGELLIKHNIKDYEEKFNLLVKDFRSYCFTEKRRLALEKNREKI